MIDAEIILAFVERMIFQPWYPPSAKVLQLHSLSRRIEQLKVMLNQELNRRHAYQFRATVARDHDAFQHPQADLFGANLARSLARAGDKTGSIGDGVIATDPDGVISLANPEAGNLAGWPPGEVVGKPLSEVLHLVDADTGTPLEDATDLDEGVALAHRTLIAGNGREISVEVNGAPIRDAKAIPIGAVLILRDITQRRRLEQELVRLERMRARSEMVQGVNHNLNNLLNGMLLPAQLLKDNLEDPKNLQRAELIETAAQKAVELVRRLNRAASGQQEQPQPVAFSPRVVEAIENTRSRWQTEAEGRGIAIDLVTNLEDVPPIYGTASEVDDILVNLIFNAVDALPEGGTITIGTQAIGDFVYLTVSDTGIGMDAETQRRVFEPLFTTKVDAGSGLGLYSVYTTVTNWGGDIEVASTLGKGTTFTLRLPVWQEKQGAQDDDIKEGKATSEQRLKMLLVEDDQMTMQALVDYLSDTCEVETITDGQTAVEVFKQGGRYEVAVIDLGIPGIPGDQVAQQIRQVDPAIATVLITGFDLDQDDRRLAAFDMWYTKPLSVEQLSEMMEQAVSLHQSRTKGNG